MDLLLAAALLDAHVADNAARIDALTAAARTLAPDRFAELAQAETHLEPDNVARLHEQRLALVQSLQYEEFAGEKLRGMIAECEELMRKMTAHLHTHQLAPEAHDRRAAADTEAYAERVVRPKLDRLGSCISTLEAQCLVLETQVRNLVAATAENWDTAASREYEAALAAAIDALNTSFAR